MTQITELCKWSALFLLVLLASCFSHIKTSSSVQKEIDDQVFHQTFWLKQSLYSGPFYDDTRFGLLSSRRFEDLKYLKTMDGDYILPPPANEIIPAGTKVTIEKIEWPSGLNILNRPILTPRHWPWLFVKVARDRGPVTVLRDSTYIFVLPNDFTNKKSFNRWLGDVFSKEDTNNWLKEYAPRIRNGIYNKSPQKGMDYRALIATLGQPDQVKKELIPGNTSSITKETATYGNRNIILENGRVAQIENK